MISFLGVRADGQADGQTARQTAGRTDRHGFGILTWKHVGTQKISTQNSKLVVSPRSLAICLPGGRGCIIKISDSLKR